MTSDALARIVVTQQLSAAPERVFDAFLKPQVARHFLFATATGAMMDVQVDARVGGHYEFTERRPDQGEVRHVGEYLTLDRPSQLAFTFGVPQFDPRMTTVTIDVRPSGEGSAVTLTNDGVPEAYAEPNRDGWNRILAGLLPAYAGVHGAGWL